MSSSTATLDQLEKLILGQQSQESNLSAAEVLASLGSPSTSCAILMNGKMASRCFSTQGDNTETLFQACSISKPVAGTMCMRLFDRGKLDIDALVVDLLPSTTLQRIHHPLLKYVTVKHLLSHTSGLSVHGFQGYHTDAVLPDAMSIMLGAAPANSPKITFESAPGHTFSYSGGGMTLLQILLEHITGKSVPQLVRELVFEPLGMKRSYYDIQSDEGNVAHAHHTGYQACDVHHRLFPEQVAAGLWTTPTDLLKLILAIQESLDACDANHTFLKPDTARKLLTEVEGGMALSWFASKVPGQDFGHGGSNAPGWRCYLVGFANLDFASSSADTVGLDRCGIAVMTNSVIGYQVAWKLIDALCFLNGWPQISQAYGVPNARVSLKAIDDDATFARRILEWAGSSHWKSSCGWQVKIQQNRVVAQFQDQTCLAILPAAMPKPIGVDDYRVDAILQDMNLMFRFRSRATASWIDVHHGGTEKVFKLTRTE